VAVFVRKELNVYLRGKYVYLVPSGQTSDGFWIEQEPAVSVTFDEFGTQAENLLLTALASSTKVVAPRHWDEYQSPVLRLSGLKSWATFVKGTRMCSVIQDAEGFTLLSQRNDGTKGGFTTIGEIRCLNSFDLVQRLLRFFKKIEK